MTELLCLLLKPALYAVSDPRKYWYLIPFAVVAWLLDVLIAHTTWPLIAGFPRIGEVTKVFQFHQPWHRAIPFESA